MFNGNLVDFISIYRTYTDLAGIPTPKHLEGKSVRPLLVDRKAEWPQPAVTIFGVINHAVRMSPVASLRREQVDPVSWRRAIGLIA